MFNVDKETIPKLDIGNKVGFTDYIDFLRESDVPYPVMRGIDTYNRPFFVIKFIIDNNYTLMQTFFQRYTNNSQLWHGCGHATMNLIQTTGGMDNEQFKMIEDIINGKVVELKDKHRLTSEDFINSKAQLYYEKKFRKAAIIIQRQWMKCRYDPSYKMCETIQDNNLKEIYGVL